MNFKKVWNKFRFFLKNYNYEWKFKLLFGAPILIILIALDWISKGIVTANMQLHETKEFIPNFVSLSYTINLGSAFGMNNSSDGLPLTITLATLLTILLVFIFIFVNGKKWVIPIAFMLAGSLANLLGRAWAPEIAGVGGGVVDMFIFEFAFLGSNQYIFNLADLWVNLSIAIGVVCFIWELVLIFSGKDKKKDENDETEG